MRTESFKKMLSANDVGATGGHQGGILIPKSERELLGFLPPLDAKRKNPDAWLECSDEAGTKRRLRFVYYNNKLHDPNGTRNEYRVTYLTAYFREVGAKEGDTFHISGGEDKVNYKIKVIPAPAPEGNTTADQPLRIKITSGWQRNH